MHDQSFIKIGITKSTSKSSRGGPLSDSKQAVRRLCRLCVARKAISWSFLYLTQVKQQAYNHVSCFPLIFGKINQ